RGEPITVYGDGTQTRSLCYVDDTVEGIVRLMNYEHTTGEVVNIGSSQEFTVLEFAHMVKQLTNSPSPIEHTEHLPQDDPHKRRAETSKAQKLLGWSAQTNLESGLRHTIEYVRSVIMSSRPTNN
ncbi:MAG TPA: GDP-mannose 4,6-dehydratase, partial [Candidatus Woesebacteria bacterium]|nr:GDP-mannose 4,6-dehydratase [Candidatus Woesebacteria bacterium]